MLSLCLQIIRSKFLQDLTPQAFHGEGKGEGEREGEGNRSDLPQDVDGNFCFRGEASIAVGSIGSVLAREPALFSVGSDTKSRL